MAKPRPKVDKSALVKSLVAERKSTGSLNGHRPRWGRGYMLLPNEEQQVALWYREGKMSFAEMARGLDCSTTTIVRTLNRLGLRSAPSMNTPNNN